MQAGFSYKPNKTMHSRLGAKKTTRHAQRVHIALAERAVTIAS